MSPQNNVVCQQCGKPFYASPGHVAKGWGKFCSIPCRTAAWRGMDHPHWLSGGDTVCLFCGKTFHAKASHVSKGEGKYCSKKCYAATQAHPEERICEHCGKTFVVYQAQIRKGGGRYCSTECAAAAQSTKVELTCQECGQVFREKQCELRRRDKRSVGTFCSLACKARAMSHEGRTRGRGRGSSKSGKRQDLGGLYVRSSWEANWARYLNWLKAQGEIRGWEYEVDTFEFPVKRGSRFYTPDFRVTNRDGSVEYHEVKGWMNPESATKLKRMARYYPEVKLVLIDKEVYQSVAREMKNLIAEWESRGSVTPEMVTDCTALGYIERALGGEHE